MFGFSIAKILFTIAVGVLTWQGFKWMKRRKLVDEARAKRALNCESNNTNDVVEALAPCPYCGVFIPVGSDHRCT